MHSKNFGGSKSRERDGKKMLCVCVCVCLQKPQPVEIDRSERAVEKENRPKLSDVMQCVWWLLVYLIGSVSQ